MSKRDAVIWISAVWISALIIYLLIIGAMMLYGADCEKHCYISADNENTTIMLAAALVVLPASYLTYKLLRIIFKDKEKTTTTED